MYLVPGELIPYQTVSFYVISKQTQQTITIFLCPGVTEIVT